MKDTINFVKTILKENNFEPNDKNSSYYNGKCTVFIKKGWLQVNFRGEKKYSANHSGYWLIGVLTKHGLI